MTSVFAAWLAATVLALVVVIASGHKAQRGLHYGSVLAFFVLLAFTILEAEEVGRGLTYEGWSRTAFYAHFSFVGLDFLLVPFLVLSGVRLARGEDVRRRKLHKKLASVFVLFVVLTCVLGALMTWGATPVAGP